MRTKYVKNVAISEKCDNKQNMQQSHIRIKLTCLVSVSAVFSEENKQL